MKGKKRKKKKTFKIEKMKKKTLKNDCLARRKCKIDYIIKLLFNLEPFVYYLRAFNLY